MIIKDMFAKDINRNIAPVIQVTLNEEEAIRQEVEEYVITAELKKHFNVFFDNYSKSFEERTTDTGVWISGFFGSGKSHLLKMLSYIIENKDIDGTSTVEYFRKKLEDDPETFSLIENSTRNSSETILFNIDVVGPEDKDDTAILRIFERMFYTHLGYYGKELKIARLEKFIDSEGKTKEFKQSIKKHCGKSWEEHRKSVPINSKFIVRALMEVMDLSEEDAEKYFKDKTAANFSMEDLVEDIKEYVDGKGKGFHLVFMADEVGQYVATNTSMLLNLQSFAETIGRKCTGKVWVVCTGQEALDKLKGYGHIREDDLSRIQDRFRTRLSLSSSSVDEVIQKRILTKKDRAKGELEKVYSKNQAILSNLFTFSKSTKSMKGYDGAEDFITNYPFIPYQFIILQEVFNQIGLHGNAGTNISRGERSMISGFQSAAIKIQDRGNTALVPFFYFYDTVQSILDSSIRQVIERCRRAAEKKEGLEPLDVDVLKLLYLILYLNPKENDLNVKDYIPSNLDNIVILMADDINTDKIKLRVEIQKSLDRLLDEIYIGKDGENYYFLTNEQQDIEREIRKTQVDASKIVKEMGNIIFDEIYNSKKYHYDRSNSDFPYKPMVDELEIGDIKGDMCLRFLTVATDDAQKQDFKLHMGSADAVFVLLSDTNYYDSLRNALKIQEYVKQNNVQKLSETKQKIIREQQVAAGKYKKDAAEALEKAIMEGRFYVNGEKKEIKGNNAKAKIDNAMGTLVESVYSKLDYITKNIEGENEIRAILRGTDTSLPGTEPNLEAIKEIEDFLDSRHGSMDSTSMLEIQNRYQRKPYGWREIDIAAVVAQLIHDQKVTVKRSGTIIQQDDSNLVGMLRKKNETREVSISKRILVSDKKIRKAKEFLREYFDIMDVHDGESGVVSDIKTKFGEQQEHYEKFGRRYEGHEYPDKELVNAAIELTKDVLSKEKDPVALIDQLLALQNKLSENKKKMRQVEGFFATQQVDIFDKAVNLEHELRQEAELGYLSKDQDTEDALNEVISICIASVENNSFDYNKISKLNGLMDRVHVGHDKLLNEKRREIMEQSNRCLEMIREAAGSSSEMKEILEDADKVYEEDKEKIANCISLVTLDRLMDGMANFKDLKLKEIDAHKNPRPVALSGKGKGKKKEYKICKRSIVFPADVLGNESDVDEYLKKVRKILMDYLKEGNGIDIR